MKCLQFDPVFQEKKIKNNEMAIVYVAVKKVWPTMRKMGKTK